MTNIVHRLAYWLARKTAPATVRNQHFDTSFVDVFKTVRAPNSHELLNELKNTAYTCANLNASVCATFPPRLYVVTKRGEHTPRVPTRELSHEEQRSLHQRPELSHHLKAARHVEEVIEHPLITLFRAVNPTHNSHDLWELTTLYQEVQGSAYWHLTFDALGIPEEIWILPSHQVQPVRGSRSTNLIDYYRVQTGTGEQHLSPEEVIHFRYPHPRDPYGPGLSPLRASFEQVALSSEYLAYKRSLWNNNAMPSVIISPGEVISEEERERLEATWMQRFSRGGNGRVLVTESNVSVDLVQHSMSDLAELAEAGVTREEIANAFGIPLAFLTTQTNLANLQAADHQHASKAIRPRLRRRDEKINEKLIPLFDPTGRLFVASDDPVPANQQHQLRQQEMDLKWGVRTINEVRAERGLPPVAWGDVSSNSQLP